MTPERQTLAYAGAGVLAMALLLAIASHRMSVGVLFVCATLAGGLVANVYEGRSRAVDALWHLLSRRRPDLTHERLTAYLIGWCAVILIAFVVVLWQVLSGT